MKKCFILCTAIISNITPVMAMDVGGNDDPNLGRAPNMNLQYEEEEVLPFFLKAFDSDELISIPLSLKKYFEKQLLKAEMFDDTIIDVSGFTINEVNLALMVLKKYERNGENDTLQMLIDNLSVSNIVELAHISTILELGVLKKIIAPALSFFVKKQLESLPNAQQKITFLKSLNKLEPFYHGAIKNNLKSIFKNFINAQRDKNRATQNRVVLSRLNIGEHKNITLSGCGKHIVWAGKDNKINYYHIPDGDAGQIQTLNIVQRGFNPNADIQLIISYDNPLICVIQNNKAIVWNPLKDMAITVTDHNGAIKGCAFSSLGNCYAIMMEKKAFIVKYGVADKAIPIVNLTPNEKLQSYCISANGEILYMLYKQNTGNSILYTYSTNNGTALATFVINDALLIQPGMPNNAIWILTKNTLNKILLNSLEPHNPQLLALESIEIESLGENIVSMEIQPNETLASLQTNTGAIEIINIARKRTEFIYQGIETATPHSIDTNIVAIESKTNDDGTSNIILINQASPEVTTNLNTLYDELSLIQLIQLTELSTITDHNLFITKLTEFLKTVSPHAQQMITHYIFSINIASRPQSSDEPPTKKSKKN